MGRIRVPASLPALATASGKVASALSSQAQPTLMNATQSYQIGIDFSARGNGFLTPGMALKLWWHMPMQDRPLDESLPDKVVIFSVAHYYSAQKYFCRVLGAVPLVEQHKA